MSKWTPYTVEYNPLAAGSIDGTDTEPHDQGILRAMHANYVPPDVTTKPENTLFVSRLPYSMREDKLYEKFSRFGKIESVHLIRDIVTGQSKGYGFVEFSRKDDAHEAMRESQGFEIEGYRVIVDKEAGHRLKGWVPRRLGGGWGGRKEAGQLRFGCVARPWKKPIIIHSKTSATSQSSGDQSHTFSSRDSDRERERHSSERREYNQSFQGKPQDQYRKHSQHDEQKSKKERDHSQRRSGEKDYKYKKPNDGRDEKHRESDRHHKRDQHHRRHENEWHSSRNDERKRQYARNDERRHPSSKNDKWVIYSSRKHTKDHHSDSRDVKEHHNYRDVEKGPYHSRKAEEKELLCRNDERDYHCKDDMPTIQAAKAVPGDRHEKDYSNYGKIHRKDNVTQYQSKRDHQCSVRDDFYHESEINDGDNLSESESVKYKKKYEGKKGKKFDELMY